MQACRTKQGKCMLAKTFMVIKIVIIRNLIHLLTSSSYNFEERQITEGDVLTNTNWVILSHLGNPSLLPFSSLGKYSIYNTFPKFKVGCPSKGIYQDNWRCFSYLWASTTTLSEFHSRWLWAIKNLKINMQTWGPEFFLKVS